MLFIPNTLPDEAEPALSLADFCDLCEARGKIVGVNDYLALSNALRRLARNERLLDEYFETLLASGGTKVSQSIVLAKRRHFYVRAMVWPAIAERKEEADALRNYSYHLTHDHNFDFMTVGYFGPGYRTTFFSSDRGRREVQKGDQFSLSEKKELMLGKGDVAIVSAYDDVHIQFPPKTLSISLNLIAKQKFRFKQAFMDFHGKVHLPVQSSSHYGFLMEIAELLGSEKLKQTVSSYFEEPPGTTTTPMRGVEKL